MARNHEKAQAMLNRWQRIKQDMERDREVRPWHTSECKTVSAAERWRQEVIKEISRGVSEIQNASLGEYRIRELNDQINKLIREKGHWERRIIELGGPDYITQAKKDAQQVEGVEAQGSMGYKYFGAAKDLPGVRELFERNAAGPTKRTRYEMHKGVTPDYYGYRDDEDGVLERYEKKAEARIRKKVVEEWHKQQALKQEVASATTAPGAADITTEEEQAGFSSLVKVPTQAQMADQLLVMKKQRLLAKLGLSPLPTKDLTPASPPPAQAAPEAPCEATPALRFEGSPEGEDRAEPTVPPHEGPEATAAEPACAEPTGQLDGDSSDDDDSQGHG